jgi:signal peptidase I
MTRRKIPLMLAVTRWMVLRELRIAAANGAMLGLLIGVGTFLIFGRGDLALVMRLDFKRDGVSRGDVVQCRFPGRGSTYVKRIIGLPGDEIAFTGGKLTVNGAPVDEPYLSSPTDDYAVRLGRDEYLALGDNRAESYDSRMSDIGPIHSADILGRVRLILFPLGRFGPVR